MKIDVFDRVTGAMVRQSDDQQMARLLQAKGMKVAWNLTAIEFGHPLYLDGFYYQRATHQSLLRAGAFRGRKA